MTSESDGWLVQSVNWNQLCYRLQQMWTCVPEAVTKDSGKYVYTTDTLRCNYLTMPLITDFGKQVRKCQRTHSAKYQIVYYYAIDRLRNWPKSICEKFFELIGCIKMVSLIDKLSSYFGDTESTFGRSKMWPTTTKVKFINNIQHILLDLLHSCDYSKILRTFRFSKKRQVDLTRAPLTNMD